jgi:hypothetical protein
MRYLTALPGDCVTYMHLGISVTAAFKEPEAGEQPYVSIDTSDMPPAYTYDEQTGLRGDAQPYSVIDTGESWDVVRAVRDGVKHVASFPPDIEGRLAAAAYAKTRNADWHKEVGMPIIAVHLNDGAAIYDDEGHGNTAHLTDQVVEQLRRMAAEAEKARDADEDRWRDVAQDTEEAEESGHLIGYACALHDVLRFLEPSEEVVG